MATRFPLLVSLVAIGALGACKSDLTTNVPPLTYGILTVGDSQRTDSGSFSVRPVGLFYVAPRQVLPNSLSPLDSCVLAGVGAGPESPVTYVSAGDSVAVATADTTAYLIPQTVSGGTSYVLRGTGAISYTPGDLFTFAVPGAAGGIPAGTVRILSVQPLTVDSVLVEPPADSAMTVTWDANGDDSTRVNVFLQYAAIPGGEIDSQLFCSWVDDGSGTIPAFLASRWRAASTSSRRASAFRWRTSVTLADSAALLGVARYDVTVPLDFDGAL